MLTIEMNAAAVAKVEEAKGNLCAGTSGWAAGAK